jgi:peptidoglycan/xylan/chitin deacetylase (PgdA/CDA1 family)
VDAENWFNSRLFDAERVRSSREATTFTSPEEDVGAVLDAFSKHGVKSTFFVLASLLEEHPTLARNIEAKGHEVGMHAYNHLEFTRHEDFIRDLQRGLEVFQGIMGKTPAGYRHPYFMVNQKKLVTLTNHFAYDTSVVPSLRIPGHYGHPFAKRTPTRLRGMVELPLSVTPYIRLPAATGWYYRNLGLRYISWIISSSLKRYGYAQICLHTWEFTSKRRLRGVPTHVFRNCGKPMEKLVEELCALAHREGATLLTCSEYVGYRNRFAREVEGILE